MLGMSGDFVPKFARKFRDIGNEMKETFRAYDEEVKATTYPAKEHTYAKSDCSDEFLKELAQMY